MLAELIITDFAIIDELRLRLASGFNVLTGETGAGKSIIIDAVSVLLGGRVESQMIRAGAERALVEGMFYLSDTAHAALDPILGANGLADNGEERDMLLLSRELRANGRAACRVNGRLVTAAVLKSIGEQLVDIHGQSEHLSLLRPKEHVNLLDRYAETWDARQQFAAMVTQWRAVHKELDDLLRGEAELARRADLLKFQVEEIGEANLKEGEEDALTAERNRLANAETLAALADEAYAALYEGAGETPAALDALAQAHKAIAGLVKIDPNLKGYLETIETVNAQIDDLAREIGGYRDGIEYSPKRLEFVEERLDLIKRLKRKYAPPHALSASGGGGGIADVLAFADKAADELDKIEHAGERIEALREEEERLLHELGGLGKQLSEARRAAAERLSAGIEAELNDLRMAGARFAVDRKWELAESGAVVDGGHYAFDATGLDKVEFLIAPNVGEGLKPLVKIASGGETARLMLALKTVLSRADQTPTLIFDEIDQGIGGRVGTTVGHKLWGLSNNHQVICITHLPQLAGFGDAHFKVEKAIAGERTLTQVSPLEDEARVEELAQMLGASGEGAMLSAQEILASVALSKAQATVLNEAG
ncbi:MAG TPA: DNA repair protein RecN [Anaerolineae bacterium]|nr:DNA repair protein RecN [Anaerolineae bacterium]